MKELQQIPGVALVEPQGAFYCLPVMTSFFGPSASAEGFGSIPDADTLCRSALHPISVSQKEKKKKSVCICQRFNHQRGTGYRLTALVRHSGCTYSAAAGLLRAAQLLGCPVHGVMDASGPDSAPALNAILRR